MLKKYPLPKNMPLAKAPTLNVGVSAMLTEQYRNRDKRVYSKQNQLGITLGAIIKAESLLLCKDPNIVNVISILSDASKLVADSHYAETETRRSLIIPLVDKTLVEPLRDRKRDEFLFGDNIGEMVKTSRGIKRAGQVIQATASTSNLNSKGPSSRGRYQQPISYVIRGKGQQRSYRRRPGQYAPSSPLAPTRRQPPAMPPQRRAPPPSSAAPPSTDRIAHP